MKPIRLGVNIDHVATVRNARGRAHPDPIAAAEAAVRAGADGITAHLREDRRHIRDNDVRRLRATLAVPLNLEMAATPEMVAIARALRPHACCLVPERRQEVTTEGGLEAAGQREALRPVVASLAEVGIRVSLFIDPAAAQVRAAAEVGAPVIELNTAVYSEGVAEEIERLRAATALGASLGLECHAGHGLTYENVGAVAAISDITELNIGHFLVGQAIFDGLPVVIARMRNLMQAARTGG